MSSFSPCSSSAGASGVNSILPRGFLWEVGGGVSKHICIGRLFRCDDILYVLNLAVFTQYV